MIKKLIIGLIITVGSFFSLIVHAQKTFRSKSSGNYNSYLVWEASTSGGPYSDAIAGNTAGINFPDQTCTVVIQSGNVVTLTQTHSARILTINAGGVLQSDGTRRVFMPVGNAQSAFGAINNNGILGGLSSGPDAISLEAYNGDLNSRGFSIGGSGTTRINRIVLQDDAVNSLHQLTVTINQSLTLTQADDYALSVVHNPNPNDQYSLVINAGRTVTISNPTGYFHNNNIGTGSGFGDYYYTINGTLDFTANTGTANYTRLQHLGNNSSVTVNVGASGLIKAGSFATSTNLNIGGYAEVYLTDGAIFDATTNGATYSFDPIITFKSVGTGKIKRAVGATDVLFPVAVPPSFEGTTINNSGVQDIFSVSMRNGFDVPPPPGNVVERQWNISEETAGGSQVTLKLNFILFFSSAGFNVNAPMNIYRHNGSSWEATPAIVTGNGSSSNPYTATATGFSSFGRFAIGNSTTLPVRFIEFKAYGKDKEIKVEWTTIGESNLHKYVVEASADGRNFQEKGMVQPKNTESRNLYSWIDATPVEGDNFYRIKSVDNDGKLSYTNILRVDLNNQKGDVQVVPNVITGRLATLQIVDMPKGVYTIRLYNTTGNKLYTELLPHHGGSTSIPLTIPNNLSTGIYFMEMTGANFTITKTIVVQ